MLFKALLLLSAVSLTGCTSLLTQFVPVPQPRLTLPTSLKERCNSPQPVDGSLKSASAANITDARDLAMCAVKHAAIVEIVDDFNKRIDAASKAAGDTK